MKMLSLKKWLRPDLTAAFLLTLAAEASPASSAEISNAEDRNSPIVLEMRDSPQGGEKIVRINPTSIEFQQPITHQSSSTAEEVGLTGLVSPLMKNASVIPARVSSIHSTKGDTATVDMYGDGLLEVALSKPLASKLHASGKANHQPIRINAAAGRSIIDQLLHLNSHPQEVSVKKGTITIKRSTAMMAAI